MSADTFDPNKVEDMWCPNRDAYDRGECCGKCPEFVEKSEAYAAALRGAMATVTDAPKQVDVERAVYIMTLRRVLDEFSTKPSWLFGEWLRLTLKTAEDATKGTPVSWLISERIVGGLI